jgi:hypothetical protein
LIDIYDSDMIAMDQGPVAWMAAHQGRSMNLDAFKQGAEEQFREVGFDATVKVFETSEPGTFAFDVEINHRVDPGFRFDPDRQVHEVTRDLLGTGESGFIKTPTAEMQAAARAKHKH